MKNIKPLIALPALLLIIIISSSFAFFYNSSTIQNRISIGRYSVQYLEDFVSPSNWLPGDTVPKIMYVFNDGKKKLALRISYEEHWYEADGVTEIDHEAIPENAVILNREYPDKWIQEGNYYYYYSYVKPGNSTERFIDSVTLNPALATPVCTQTNEVESCRSYIQGLNGAKCVITFTIETVPYEMYQQLWNTNVTIEPNMITFTLDGVTYTAEENSDWEEFAVSSYNVSGVYIDAFCITGNPLIDIAGETKYIYEGNDDSVLYSTFIIEDGDEYYTRSTDSYPYECK